MEGAETFLSGLCGAISRGSWPLHANSHPRVHSILLMRRRPLSSCSVMLLKPSTGKVLVQLNLLQDRERTQRPLSILSVNQSWLVFCTWGQCGPNQFKMPLKPFCQSNRETVQQQTRKAKGCRCGIAPGEVLVALQKTENYFLLLL